ncbi:E3 ubiquitin-protein ligase ATL59 [Glycine soja]|uniref:E3 ubiquitin-protein ligase ATL59 n=2 Tax=Glycine soja TaxID=3848 RepID=A0A445L6M1_GLYSO|nr:E3 ubiquitin-protein ligase ATL59 [Glycine soja]
MASRQFLNSRTYPKVARPGEMERERQRKRLAICKTNFFWGLWPGLGNWFCEVGTMGIDTNLVTTVIGFGLSATFIVFVCARIICGRLRERTRTIYEIEAITDIERAEYHGNDPAPAFVAAIPTLNFNHEAFSSIETTQCVICLAEYKEKELLRIIPKCGHTFHLSCIDMWLRKQSTCPVCRLSLQNALETKHVRHATFTIRHSLDESNTAERNTDSNQRLVELDSSNDSQQPTLGEPEARQ